MNAQHWLEEATKEMPEAVRRRVQAETLAHLEDARVGQGADVRSVLGSPQTLRKELGRLYVPAKRLSFFTEDASSSSIYVMPCFSLVFALLGIRLDNNSAHDTTLQQVVLLVFGLWLLALFLTKVLSSARRHLWRGAMSSATVGIHYWLYFLSIYLDGDITSHWWVAFLILYPFSYVYSLWRTKQEDARLHRTLALVGGAQL